MTYEEAFQLALETEWETFPCNCGEDLCDDIGIKTTYPVQYDPTEGWDQDNYVTILNPGAFHEKELIEHIVEAHNKFIYESDGRRDTRSN